ncbi:MAG TPA: Clp protease N-terminal domain-containing protein [Pseudonocardiaceae bacterium]
MRAKLEETFGADALDRLKSGGSGEATEWRRGRFIGGRPGLTKEAKKAIELSLREAVRLRSGEIDTPHVLLGLLREQRGLGVRILRENGVDLAELRQRALTSLGKAA